MKHTTLTPPTLKIAIVSAILGLGMATTASAQAQSGSIGTIEEIEEKAKKIAEQAGTGKITDNEVITKLLGLSIQGNQISIQDLNTRSDINKDNIAQNKSDIAENKKNIQINDDYIGDLYEANAENVNRLIEHGDKIWANEESVQYLNKEVQNLKADADASFETLTKNQNALIEQDEAINQELEGFAAHADVQDKQILQNQADIANNQADIANNINNIYELAQQQDQHSSDIKNLGKASLTNTKRITTAELGIAENKKDALIAKAQADKNQIDIIKNKADADAKFKGVQTDVANNKTTLAQHTKKIDDNQKAIEAKLSGKVDTQKLVDLETKVKQNQDKQDKVGETLTTVQENYSQLNTQVQSVDNKIGMVDTRVNALDDKVENSMAAQAALNGLFQPYNVGKVSVSVAVGAYGSKSAIAVGAGYRVNPHLAFKGGAAINTSGSRKGSYNLGINYEF